MTLDRLSNSSPGLHHPIFEKVDGNTCLINLLSSLNEIFKWEALSWCPLSLCISSFSFSPALSFIYLARSGLSCGTQDPGMWDWTYIPCTGRRILNHSTAREVPLLLFPTLPTPPLDRATPPSSVSFPRTTYGMGEAWWKFVALRTVRRINFCRWWNCLVARIRDADDINQSTRLHIWHTL